MGEPTEISNDELAELEKAVEDYNSIVMRREIPRLVAALRSTRERLAAAEAVCEVTLFLDDAGDGADCGKYLHGNGGAEHGGCSYCEALDTWRAVAHPTTEEPTE